MSATKVQLRDRHYYGTMTPENIGRSHVVELIALTRWAAKAHALLVGYDTWNDDGWGPDPEARWKRKRNALLDEIASPGGTDHE